jgi:tetratricopeptide (TPR) repeat protein
MDDLLQRPSAPPRIFPPITPRLYGAQGAGTQGPGAVLALATRRLAWWQRFGGMGLDAAGRLARLLYLHREAFEAELAGDGPRADVLWDELRRWLVRIAGDNACWSALVALLGPAVDGSRPTAAPARARLVDELLIDTHLAFWNGLAGGSAPELASRAWTHLDRATVLLPWSGLGAQEREALGRAVATMRIEGLAAAGKWGDAAEAAGAALQQAPGDDAAQDRYVELVAQAALASVAAKPSNATAEADVAVLAQAIRRLDAFRSAHPENPVVFEALGSLALHLGSAQAWGGRLPEALESVERALAFDPSLPDARSFRGEVEADMVAARTRIAALRDEVRKNPALRLSDDAARAERQLSAGTGPRDAYLASPAPREVAEARVHAEAVRLWRDLGFPRDQATLDRRAERLFGAMTEIYRDPPRDAAGLMNAWAHAVSGDPVVAGLDAGPILRFLHTRIFGEEDGSTAEAPSPSAGAPRIVPGPTPSARSGRRRAAAGYWLLSRRDLRLKVQVAAAVLLVGFAVTDTVSERARRGRWESAWAQLDRASRAGDLWGVMSAAERYLEDPPEAVDPRADQVRSAYADAIVRGVMRSAPDDPRLRPHLDRYRALITR